VEALAAIRRDQSISALYGFSGGGYNAAYILDDLTDAERDRIKLVIVLGAPKTHRTFTRVRGSWSTARTPAT
jgi:NADH/NAD ratio-sensing transcriptional regulator Rex